MRYQVTSWNTRHDTDSLTTAIVRVEAMKFSGDRTGSVYDCREDRVVYGWAPLDAEKELQS